MGIVNTCVGSLFGTLPEVSLHCETPTIALGCVALAQTVLAEEGLLLLPHSELVQLV